MPKRRIETTSSSSSGGGDNNDGSSQSSINDSTSTVTRACSSTSAARQSQSALRMSKRLSSKVSKVPKPNKNYFEGCLVMGQVQGYPFWPGMIRKPKPEEDKHHRIHGYICCPDDGKTYYFVQFFDVPTSWKWLTAKKLKVYDANSPAHNRCRDRDPAVVAKLVKAVKIIKAAVNYSVEERLAKFTLVAGAPIDGLLADIENGNGNIHRLTNAAPPQPLPLAAQPLPPAGQSLPPPPREPAPAAQRNRPSSTDPFARVKKVMLETRQKLRETEESNEGLKAENSKLRKNIDHLNGTVLELKRQVTSNSSVSTKITSLEQTLKLKDNEVKAQAKEILDLRANLEREREEKRKCEKELETMRSGVQSLEELIDIE